MRSTLPLATVNEVCNVGIETINCQHRVRAISADTVIDVPSKTLHSPLLPILVIASRVSDLLQL